MVLFCFWAAESTRQWGFAAGGQWYPALCAVWVGTSWPLGWPKPHFKGPAGTQSRSQPCPSTSEPKYETHAKQSTWSKRSSVTHQITPKQKHKQGPLCYFVPISVTPIQCFTREVWIWLPLESLASPPTHTMFFMPKCLQHSVLCELCGYRPFPV